MTQTTQQLCFEEFIEIGGVKQYIQVKGNPQKELLLYLHGGPAMPVSPVADIFQKQLQQNFLVVNWDQRGCGKSFNASSDISKITIKQLLQDAEDVMNYLLQRFNKHKLFLVGQSFGSVLGLRLAKRCPEKIYVYVSTGQVVDINQNEEITYLKTLDQAKTLKNEEALNELKAIGKPPYKNMIEGISIQRKWLHTFGFIERKHSIFATISQNMPEEEFKSLLSATEKCGKQLLLNLLSENINFFTEIIELNVPVIFCAGRYDYATPAILTEKYCEQLNAPFKQLVYFEDSAHFPDYAEPIKFANTLLNFAKNL